MEKIPKPITRKPKKREAYAFWDVDFFPYLNGGKVKAVVKIRFKGEPLEVFTKEHGEKQRKAPYLADAETGKKLLQQIAHYHAEFLTDLAMIRQGYTDKIAGAIALSGINPTKKFK